MREQNLPHLSPAELNNLPSPAYLIDEALLRRNLKILQQVRQETGCSILLAQKAFSAYHLYPLIRQYLDGTTASGIHEARLGREEMPTGEVHCFSPGYTDKEMAELLPIVDHLVFNSWSQWLRFKPLIEKERQSRPVSVGLRINPEYSEGETEIYDPCAPGSRLGTRLEDFVKGFEQGWAEGLDGLHFHTLCEQNSDALAHTWDVFKKKFSPYFKQFKWLNMGGGHHITRPDYDLDLLKKVIREAQGFNLHIYLEPGEAIAYNAGFLIARVVDVVYNSLPVAILDTSAVCHMPDVIEMPYRPRIFPLYQEQPTYRNLPRLAFHHFVSESDNETARQKALGLDFGELAEDPAQTFSKAGFTYRLAGPTCLAGDVIGDYKFPAPLEIGDALIFCDMAIYSMVKTNTFNGMPLPQILLIEDSEKYEGKNKVKILNSFGYEDFRRRL